MTDFQRALVEENIQLVEKVIRNRIRIANRPMLTYDDFFSVGAEALCNAAMRYDSSSGEFAPYATKTIYHAMVDYCRTMNYRAQKVQDTVFEEGVDSLFDRIAAIQLTPDEYIIDAEVMDAFHYCEGRYKGVAAKGIRAIKLKLMGFESSEIAAMYGTSINNVNAWISRARSKLKKDDIINRMMF